MRWDYNRSLNTRTFLKQKEIIMIYYIIQAKRELTFRKKCTRLKEANELIEGFRKKYGDSYANLFEIKREERIGTNQAKSLFDKRKYRR